MFTNFSTLKWYRYVLQVIDSTSLQQLHSFHKTNSPSLSFFGSALTCCLTLDVMRLYNNIKHNLQNMKVDFLFEVIQDLVVEYNFKCSNKKFYCTCLLTFFGNTTMIEIQYRGGYSPGVQRVTWNPLFASDTPC